MIFVRIYGTRTCGYCYRAREFFDRRGIPYENIDLTGNPEGRRALAQRSGRDTVPQIYVGDTHVGGYTDLRDLDARGGLEPLLKG